MTPDIVHRPGSGQVVLFWQLHEGSGSGVSFALRTYSRKYYALALVIFTWLFVQFRDKPQSKGSGRTCGRIVYILQLVIFTGFIVQFRDKPQSMRYRRTRVIFCLKPRSNKL